MKKIKKLDYILVGKLEDLEWPQTERGYVDKRFAEIALKINEIIEALLSIKK